MMFEVVAFVPICVSFKEKLTQVFLVFYNQTYNEYEFIALYL